MFKCLLINFLLGVIALPSYAQSSTKKSASPQLSRTFTESFTSNVDDTDTFVVFVVEGFNPENGVKFVPPQGFFNIIPKYITSLPSDQSFFTYEDPGVYIVAPYKDGVAQCAGKYIVMNEDYVNYYTSQTDATSVIITKDYVVHLNPHSVGSENSFEVAQARWDE